MLSQILFLYIRHLRGHTHAFPKIKLMAYTKCIMHVSILSLYSVLNAINSCIIKEQYQSDLYRKF
jgi:hypothetical protein